ncbi:MAG: DUF2612 domain-containing protein [Alicyclobacillus sp.]|nr:DUF2612 domain-containing protein [Alicyclobacillus sp.]
MAITKYLNLITSAHNQQPKFMAWLSAALQKVDDGMTLSNNIPQAFSVDEAVGPQLDVVGQLVGANRDVGVPLASGSSILDDDHYRTYIRAQIAKNQWDGTLPSLYDIWDSVFPDAQLQIIDNQNMTMQAVVNNLTDNIHTELITAGLIIPKPAGVGLSIIEQTNVTEQAYVGLIVSGSDCVTLATNTPTKHLSFISPNQVAVYYT